MLEGFLEMGGTELINSSRSQGYTSTADCPINWLTGPVCEGIADALGDTGYTISTIADAPWYDVEDEVSHRFLGAAAVTFEGVSDSTRDAAVQEAITDGGVVGRVRHGSRRIRVRALLTGLGEDALEYGLSWLNAALQGGGCQAHGDSCGTADARFFVACPPSRSEITMPQTVWNDPVTNLATNPSFETGAPVATVRTNLATNPSFETNTAATAEVRRNWLLSPRMENSVSNWAVNGAGVTQTAAVGGTRIDFASAFSALSPFLYPAAVAPSAAGEVAYASMEVTVPVGQPAATFALRIQVYQSGGASVDGGASSPVTTIQPGQTVRLTSTSWTASATGVGGWRIWLNVAAPGVAAGSNVTVRNAIIEKSSDSTAPYFDGSTLPAGDFTYAWTGAADGTPSVQYGIAAQSPFSPSWGHDGSSVAVQSTEWASSGVKSYRAIPKTAAAYQYLNLGTSPLTAGKVYTALATFRMKDLQTHPTPGPRARSLAYTESGATIVMAQAPNAPGVYTLRITFTLGATGTRLLMFTGQAYSSGTTAESKDVWWDDLLIVEGAYTGPYFDGSVPAKLRRNLFQQPIPATAAYYPLSRGVVTFVSDPTGDYAHGVCNAAGSLYWNFTAAVNRVPVSPGQTVTFQAESRVGGGSTSRFVRLYWLDAAGVAISSGPDGPTVTGADQWQLLSWTATAPAAAVAAGVYLLTTPSASVDWTSDVRRVMWEVSNTLQPYFDGSTALAGGVAGGWDGTADASPSYLYDPDFSYAWSGTANASTGLQQIPTVATYGAGAAVDGLSGVWSKDRGKSLRIISQYPARGSAFVDIAGHLSPRGLVPGTTYTASVVLRMDQLQGFTSAGTVRSLTLTGTTGYNAQAAGLDQLGEQLLTMTFTVPPTGNWYLRLYNGSAMGEPDIWFDNLLIVEGSQPVSYFDGTTADSAASEVIGDQVDQYAWTGTADASTSTWQHGVVASAPDPVAYDAAVAALSRTLHGVSCVSGPIVEQKLHRSDTWGYLVEFVLVAGVPWLFGATRLVTTPPSLPVVVQDVPFNLVPYPSAELSTGTVTAAVNYSDNPSVELSGTNWAQTSTVVQVADVSGARSTALSATGAAAFRTRLVASNTSAVAGEIMAQNTSATFPAAVAGTRMSVNMWASAQVVSGTAVISKTEVIAIWRAGATVLRSDIIGQPATGGGAVSGKSIAVPVTADNVIMRARTTLASWSTGATVDLYGDACAVTVP